jgi:hypothetical protein
VHGNHTSSHKGLTKYLYDEQLQKLKKWPAPNTGLYLPYTNTNTRFILAMYENIFMGEILSLGEKIKNKKGGFWGFF